jgi:hypothetical protein
MFDTEDLKLMDEIKLFEQLELLEWNYFKFPQCNIYSKKEYYKYRARIMYYLNKV